MTRLGTTNIRSVCKIPRIQHPEAIEPAHISAEESKTTKTKQRQPPNKPVSHQTDQNLKSQSNAQLSRAVARQLQMTPTKNIETNLQKPRSQHTFEPRELAKQKTNSKNSTNQQADQNIAKSPGQQPGSPQLPKGPTAGAKPYETLYGLRPCLRRLIHAPLSSSLWGVLPSI